MVDNSNQFIKYRIYFFKPLSIPLIRMFLINRQIWDDYFQGFKNTVDKDSLISVY